MSFRAASQALSRFTVLDLTRARSGPTCTRQLGDWGANVIKIEMPDMGDGGGDPMGTARDGSDFMNLHRNKRSLTLNLKTPEGVTVFKRLAEKADVVVENFRPDVKTRLGIDYPALSAVNPRIVYASISGFGQDGPYARRPGLDQIAQGMSGLMSITGLPGQGPVRAGIAVADSTAGHLCAQGILTALLEREVSGKGQFVHTSLLEALIFLLDFQAARWLVDKEVPPQSGNDHPTILPTGVFETTDGYINIAAGGDKMWAALCEMMEAPQLAQDPRFVDRVGRASNRAQLNDEITKRTRQHDSAWWIEKLNKAGVPCGPIYTMDQTFADAQVKHLNLVQELQTSFRGKIDQVAQAVHLERTPSALVTEPPVTVGQHSDEILGEFGFTSDEIEALRRDRIL